MWPIRTPLQKDEALCTWIARAGAAMGVHARELYSGVLPGSRNWPVVDVDTVAAHSILDALSSVSGQDITLLRRATFLRYEGILYEDRNSQNSKNWIVTCDTVRTQPEQRGYPVCLKCLATDPIPYFRLGWRLVCCPTCTIHKCLLVCHCPGCGASIHPWGYPTDVKFEPVPYCRCYRCSCDLRDLERSDTCISCDDLEHFASQLESGTLEEVAGGPHVEPLAYYWGLGIVLTLVASRRWGPKIQTSFESLVKDHVDQLTINYRGSIGALSPRERLVVCGRALEILKNWPASLSQFCRDFDLKIATLTEFNRGLPYWMHKELDAILAPRYRPNFDEVEAAARALSNSGMELNRHQLERYIGVVESKHVDIQIAPLPSKFSAEEARSYFSTFDRLILNATSAKGRKYCLARDRTITVLASAGRHQLHCICRWTWSEPIVQRAYELSKYRILSPRPPLVRHLTVKEIERHLAWFISNFFPEGGRSDSAVFVARSGEAVGVETVRIASGKVKKLAGLKNIRTCITGLSRLKPQGTKTRPSK